MRTTPREAIAIILAHPEDAVPGALEWWRRREAGVKLFEMGGSMTDTERDPYAEGWKAHDGGTRERPEPPAGLVAEARAEWVSGWEDARWEHDHNQG